MPLSPYYHAIRSAIGDQLLIMPAVNAIVVNERGEVLLQRRTDDGQWTNPGGAIEPGEHPAHALVREIKEETGLDVKPLRITGIYSGPEYIHTYPNGNQAAFVSISFLCQVTGGELGGDPEETAEVRFFAPEALPAMHPRFIRRIRDALSENAPAAFDNPPLPDQMPDSCNRLTALYYAISSSNRFSPRDSRSAIWYVWPWERIVGE